MGGIGTIDCRDASGSSTFVCQTRMSCDLSAGMFMTATLVDMPFALHFRFLGGGPSGPRFDIAEGVRREKVRTFVTRYIKSSIDRFFSEPWGHAVQERESSREFPNCTVGYSIPRVMKIGNS